VNRRLLALASVLPAVLLTAGCGGGRHQASSSPPTRTQSTTQETSTSPGALQAEAASVATGDIPDNQLYLVYHSSDGWSMKYPEGWAQSGSPSATVFQDKNNIVRAVVRHGSLPGVAQVRSDHSLRAAHITSGPAVVSPGGAHAIKVVYTTQSAPNAVTGKRVTLTVDRYYLASAGRVATIDLGTPVGVDNVDAYRLMIESFRWR
jgi:beta-galactosidase GanA